VARSEARLRFDIWRGLDGLSAPARLLYAVLLTEPTVNHAGVGALRLSKWAANCGLSLNETQKALHELMAGEWVFVDGSTEEVLVRTMIRRDGVAEQPNLLKCALREAVQTESGKLRRVLAAELRKLPPRRPDGVSKTGRMIIYPDPHKIAEELERMGSRNPSATHPEPIGNPSKSEPFRNPSGTPLEPPGVGVGVGEKSYLGSNSGLEPKNMSKIDSVDRDDCDFNDFWAVYPRKVKKLHAQRAWRAACNRPGVDPARLIDAAHTYAQAVAGQDTRYVLHPATWLNSGAYDDKPEQKQNHQQNQPTSAVDRNVQGWLTLGATPNDDTQPRRRQLPKGTDQ
jgi:hypothetical protein